MKSSVKTTYAGLVLLVALMLNGCVREQTGPVNLTVAKNRVINYQENGGFHTDAVTAVDKAIKEFDKITPGKKTAVIFDVDETTLSNYMFNKENDFGYIEKNFDLWIDSAKAPAITEVKRLYDYLAGRNFRIIFLTGRKTYQYEATMKNLAAAGYSKFDTLIVREPAYYGLTALKYKSDKRAVLVKTGYVIVGTVGDQWSDLDGPDHGIQVKIPNYQYYIQ